MTTNNMTGLKQRKTFEEVIDYIQNDKTKIKYPDRTAKFLRNSFELSQLDNAGMILMEQQQMREMKQREKEHLLRQLVANTSKSITEARAADDSIEHQFDSSFDYFLPSDPQSPDVATTQQPPPAGTVSAGVPQTPAHLTPAQQQVNIAFPGALSSSSQTGASSSQGPAQEEEEESEQVREGTRILEVPKEWKRELLLAEIDKHPMVFAGTGVRGKSRAIMYNALKSKGLLPNNPPS